MEIEPKELDLQINVAKEDPIGWVLSQENQPNARVISVEDIPQGT